MRTWHGLFLFFTTVLLLLVMATVIRAGNLAREGNDLVQHTDQVIGQYLRVRGAVLEAESATLGYAMTRDETLRNDFLKSASEAGEVLTDLDRITRDDPSQQRLLSETRALVESRLTTMRQVVDVAQAGDADQPLRDLIIRDAAVAGQVTHKIDQGVSLQRQLQSQRSAALGDLLQTMTVTGIGGVILAVATGLISFVLIHRSHRKIMRSTQLEAEARRALEADAQKSRFLANMSHEIRTPMNAIIGFADLLSGMVREERARGYVRAIQTSGRSLLDLINDILDISRIEAGKLTLRAEPCDVREVLDSVLLVVKNPAEEKGLALEAKVERAVPAILEIDGLRLRQMLLNLVTNAVRYTAAGGVVIQIGGQEALREAGEFDLLLEVTDTGVGIAREDQERIFAAFEQVSTKSRSGAQGTGLGLSITRKLVDLMGGTISVTSAVGLGSTFTIALPRVPIGTQPLDPPSDREVDFNRLRPATIMIVDDNLTNRELIAGYLHGTHHQLLFARDGIEAVELARVAQPDAILMDIRMPRMDGKSALRLLRDDERTERIPVIAQTASSMQEESTRLKRMFDGYLAKPFHQRDLYAQLEPVLGYATVRFGNKLAVANRVAAAAAGSAKKSAVGQWNESEWPSLNPQVRQWKERDIPRFLKTFPMLEISRFARRIQSAATECGCAPLEQFGKDLESAAEAFELARVEALLRTLGGPEQAGESGGDREATVGEKSQS